MKKTVMDTNDLIQTLIAEGARKPMPGVPRQLAAWMLGTLTWLSLIVWHSGLRPDFAGKIAEPFYVPELILLGGAGLSMALAALALARPDGARMLRAPFLPLGFLATWSVAAMLGMAPMGHAAMAQIMDTRQFDCVACIAALGVPPGLAMLLMVRGGATVHSWRAGFMAACAAATFAYLCMRLIEPNDHPAHLLVWHAGPVLVLSLMGAILGKFVLRWK